MTPDKYFRGKVIVRAEKQFPLGLIKMEDIFANDSHMESPSRAVIYRIESTDNQLFNLHDSIWFKIKIEGPFQYACDLRKELTSKEALMIASPTEKLIVVKKLQMNLHNADPHREGPQHTLRHIVELVSEAGLSLDFRKLKTYQVGDLLQTTEYIYMRTEDVPEDHSIDYYFAEICSNCCCQSTTGTGTGSDKSLWEASPTHDHVH